MDCGKKHASFGLKGLGSKKQWCGPCAKEQAGETELIGANICETCGKKQAHFGLKGGKNARFKGGGDVSVCLSLCIKR